MKGRSLTQCWKLPLHYFSERTIASLISIRSKAQRVTRSMFVQMSAFSSNLRLYQLIKQKLWRYYIPISFLKINHSALRKQLMFLWRHDWLSSAHQNGCNYKDIFIYALLWCANSHITCTVHHPTKFLSRQLLSKHVFQTCHLEKPEQNF